MIPEGLLQMLIRILCAATMMLPGIAIGQSPIQSTYNETFQSLCIADGVSGLNWINGQWVHTRFTETKFIVRKIRPPEEAEPTRWADNPAACTGADWQAKMRVFAEIHEGKTQKIFDLGCYIQYELGQEPALLLATICSEWYGTTGEIESIQCPTMTFLPNGPFHKAYWHGQLRESTSDGGCRVFRAGSVAGYAGNVSGVPASKCRGQCGSI